MAVTRDDVIQTAIQLLQEVGLDGLTLRRLATELGISKDPAVAITAAVETTRWRADKRVCGGGMAEDSTDMRNQSGDLPRCVGAT